MNVTPSLPSFIRRMLIAGLVALALGAQAQEYHGPVKLLVGYPPGGGADTAARIVADKLSMLLNQPVVVDNKPGAGGMIAAQALKNAPADGSVLFLSNTHTMITVPLTVKTAGYATGKDFRPVGAVATFELALAAHPATSAKTIGQLGQWFGTHADLASIGVPAPASAPEFMAMRVARSFKVDSVPVPYKGATPMVQDLIGGQLLAGVSGVSDFLQYHRAGRLNILAVTRRTPLLPDVPSFAEAGLPGLELTELLGLYAPASTPSATVARYNLALTRALAMPDVVEKFKGQDMTVLPGTPQEHAERLAGIERILSELVRTSGYNLERSARQLARVRRETMAHTTVHRPSALAACERSGVRTIGLVSSSSGATSLANGLTLRPRRPVGAWLRLADRRFVKRSWWA